MSQLKIFDIPETKPKYISFFARFGNSSFRNYEVINTLWDNVFIGKNEESENILLISFNEQQDPYHFQQIYSMP